eukprot:TRINITY_DN3854_c0_g1_i1.p1 TRINITY_DN3854_c0_g1~~TRINITY_DN3854_c0_g1_i1.p1  ORF type:complete len:1428 (-),score=188.68 TRINITY_DN3854_c0_g1_i1:1332-5615(-)
MTELISPPYKIIHLSSFMDSINSEKLLDTVRHILTSVDDSSSSELHRLGHLRCTIEEFAGSYISLETVKLIIEHVWSPCSNITPYLVMHKLAVFEAVCKDYLRNSVPGHLLMKYLGQSYTLLKYLLVHKGVFEASMQMFPEKWLYKQIAQHLYKLIKHKTLQEPLSEFMDPGKLKDYLHYFYAEVAYSKLSNENKYEIIQEAIRVLDLMPDSKECALLLGRTKDQEFLHKVLLKLQRKMELDSRHKLQAELEEKLKAQVLLMQHDSVNIKELIMEWQKVREVTEAENRIISAIAFIYGESRDKSTEDHTEFTFDFLMIYEKVFTKSFKGKKKTAKFNKFVAFSKMWQMLLKLETISPFFQDAVVLKAISVYKKLIKDADLAEYAGMGLNLLGKIVQPEEYVAKYVDSIIPTILFGVFFQQRPGTKKVLLKTLDDALNYMIKQSRKDKEPLYKLQFLNIEAINREKTFGPQYLRETLYENKDEALTALEYMVDYLPNANIYSQNLTLMFLNDILGGSERYLQDLKKIIEESPDLSKKICHNLVRVNRSYTMNKLDITVAQSCARCIQILGPSKVSYNLHQYAGQVWIAGKELWKLREKPYEQGELLLGHLQGLAFKANKHFHNYIMSIWKLKYLLYVDYNGELAKKIPDQINECFQFPEGGGYAKINRKLQVASKSVGRYETLIKYHENNNMRYLCLYLISKIQNDSFRKVFEEIESVIRADTNILMDLVPILIYLVLYHTKDYLEGQLITDQITAYLCEVIEGSTAAHKHIVFFCLEYLKKLRAYEYSRIRTEVKKTLNLSCSDSFLEQSPKNTSSQTQTVADFIGQKDHLQVGLSTNRLITRLIKSIPRINLIKAAKSIRAYKVALYYFEEECRARVSEISHTFDYMFCVLSREELDLLIDIYSNVNKEDLKSEYFSNIIKPSQWTRGLSPEKCGAIATEQDLIYCWKKGLWDELKVEVDKEELGKTFNDKKSMIDFSFSDNTSLACIARILSLIYTLVQHCSPDKYKTQYELIMGYMAFVQKEIMVDLCGASTTSTYIHSFYLYLLYDMRQFLEVVKNIISSASALKTPIELFADDVYQPHFDELCKIFLERERLLLGKDIDQLKTLYFTHRALFQIIKRPLYATLYTEKLAVLLSKHKEDYFDAFTLFNECELYKEYILDYELQRAKTISTLGSDYQASLYLRSQIPEIKRKIQALEKVKSKNLLQTTTSFRTLESSLLYLIKLEERFTINYDLIENLYKELFSLENAKTWEKAHFKHAKFLESLPHEKGDFSEKILAEYLNSLVFGHRYIWQSLPKALNLWFDMSTNSSKGVTIKINAMVKQVLQRLELFKIATAVPILISRYGHPSIEVVLIIQEALARLTVEYPMQQVWWLMNYYTYKEPSDKKPAYYVNDKGKRDVLHHGKLKQEFGTFVGYKRNSQRDY